MQLLFQGGHAVQIMHLPFISEPPSREHLRHVRNSNLSKNKLPTVRLKQIFNPTSERAQKYWSDNPMRVALCNEWENKTGQGRPNYIVSGEREGEREREREEGREASSQPKIIQRAACSFWLRSSSSVGRYKHHPLSLLLPPLLPSPSSLAWSSDSFSLLGPLINLTCCCLSLCLPPSFPPPPLNAPSPSPVPPSGFEEQEAAAAAADRDRTRAAPF